MIDCIHHDPRWDHQVEDRGWYYASLVADLGVAVGLVLPTLDLPVPPGGDDGFWLATDVLAHCARRGQPGAIAELRRYLRSGRDHDLAFEALAEFAAHPEADGFIDELVSIAEPAAIADAIQWSSVHLDQPPWPTLRGHNHRFDEAARIALDRQRHPPAAARHAHVHRMANLYNADGPARTEPRLGDRGETTVDLLAAAAQQPNLAFGFAQALAQRRTPTDVGLLRAAAAAGAEGTRAAAFLALGEQGDDALLELGLPLLTPTPDPDRLQRAVLIGLRKLSSPAAMTWARASALDPACGYAAQAVLATHAVHDDLPQLRALLDQAIDDESIYEQCRLVDALHRLQDDASIPAFSTLHDATTYSFLRRRCVTALAVLDPTFPDRAYECLWDSEAETRCLGVDAVSATASARARLAAMDADPNEDDTVRTRIARRRSQAGT